MKKRLIDADVLVGFGMMVITILLVLLLGFSLI